MVKPVMTRMRGKDGMTITIRPKPVKRFLAKREEKKPKLQDIVTNSDGEGQHLGLTKLVMYLYPA